jgi:hypothetical protein
LERTEEIGRAVGAPIVHDDDLGVLILATDQVLTKAL